MHTPAPGCMHPGVSKYGYTSSMRSAPPEQPPAGEPGEDEAERYGPLIVRRMVKEDGRALIRFERADDERE
jgi:hypothetical protein